MKHSSAFSITIGIVCLVPPGAPTLNGAIIFIVGAVSLYVGLLFSGDRNG